MSSNGVKDFDALKATPSAEFWRLYELFKKKLYQENNKNKK